MQRVVHKGMRGRIGKVWHRNGHRRENRTGERHAFQNARDGVKVVLSIASGTAGHVGLIDHRYLGRRLRHDGFGSCRE
jgi:hypothetical protein